MVPAFVALCAALSFSGWAFVLAAPRSAALFPASYGLAAAAFGVWTFLDARKAQRQPAWAAAALLWPAGLPAYLISGRGLAGAGLSFLMACGVPVWIALGMMARGTLENRLTAALVQAEKASQAGDTAALRRLRERAPGLAQDANASYRGPFLELVAAGEDWPSAAEEARRFLNRRQESGDAKRGFAMSKYARLENDLLALLLARLERRRALEAALSAVQRGDPSVPDAAVKFGELEDRVQGLEQERSVLGEGIAPKSRARLKDDEDFLAFLAAEDERQAAALRPVRAIARLYRDPRVRDAQLLALQAGQVLAKDPRAALALAQQAAAKAPELAGNQLVFCMMSFNAGAYDTAQAACEAGLAAAPSDPTIPEANRPQATATLRAYRALSLLRRWKALPKTARKTPAAAALLAQAKADLAAACPGGQADNPACKGVAAELAQAAAPPPRARRR